LKRSDFLLISAGLLIGAGLAVFLFFGLDLAGNQQGIEENHTGADLPGSAALGRAAPDFELETFGGENVRLRDLRGKIVLINFWATWCEPCKIEMPFFERLYQENKSRLEILAVNFDEDQQKVEQFAQEYGLSFPVLLDPGAEVQNLYRVRGYPTTFIVNEAGITSFHHIGLITEEQVFDSLSQLGVSQ
jgi:thiol-disulfide isomerase/thioredoxin